MKNNVCAVMVSHNASEDTITKVIEGILHQVDRIVIVDNASNQYLIKYLQSLSERYNGKIALILNTENRWMAAALNQGIHWAIENGYHYILHMNDGNYLSPTAVDAMLRCFESPDHPPIGVIVPRVILSDTPFESDQDTLPVKEELIITAGSLVPTKVFTEVGLYREDFLIDMVDFDFGFRVKLAGYQTLSLPSVTIACELGRTKEVRFLGRDISVFNYSPIRRYYFARNGLALLRENGNRSLRNFYWKFLFLEIIKILLFEQEKLKKLTMTLQGMRHALQKRLGHYETS